MKIGEVSKPIKKQNNILFLKLNNKRTINPEQLEIKKSKSDIIEKKKAGLFNLYSRSFSRILFRLERREIGR